MVKCIYLKNVRNSGNILFFNHYKIFHTLWWLRGGSQHNLQSPVVGGWVGKQIWERFPKKKRFFFGSFPKDDVYLYTISPR